MKKNVFIINGSARASGNTDTILEYIIKGVGDSLKTECAVLRSLHIESCNGCYECIETGECPICDDMRSFYPLLEKADLLIFATPNYFCGVTGIMKTFLDRMFVYFNKKAKPRIAGKKAILIITMNQKELPSETKIILNTFKIPFKHFGINLVASHIFSEIMEKNAVLKREDYLNKAYEIGQKLLPYCNYVNQGQI